MSKPLWYDRVKPPARYDVLWIAWGIETTKHGNMGIYQWISMLVYFEFQETFEEKVFAVQAALHSSGPLSKLTAPLKRPTPSPMSLGRRQTIGWFSSQKQQIEPLVSSNMASWKMPHLYGYGSIPINTIFSGMNIHLPAILGFTRYQGFDTLPYSLMISQL